MDTSRVSPFLNRLPSLRRCVFYVKLPARAAAQVCMMPQNVTSYGAARSSVHHHTIWASHHKPRSTSWLDGVIAAGCQATTTCSTDVTPLRPSLTASLPHPPNGMTLPVDEVKGAKPAGSVSINDATGLDSVTKHYKVNQRCPRRHLKKNRTIRRRQNTKQEMSNSVVTPHVEEDWESEYLEVMSDGLENTPYGPEDVSRFAVKDVMQEDSRIPVWSSFQPAHDHPEPVQWLRIRASTEADQFTDADH